MYLSTSQSLPLSKKDTLSTSFITSFIVLSPFQINYSLIARFTSFMQLGSSLPYLFIHTLSDFLPLSHLSFDPPPQFETFVDGMISCMGAGMFCWPLTRRYQQISGLPTISKSSTTSSNKQNINIYNPLTQFWRTVASVSPLKYYISSVTVSTDLFDSPICLLLHTRHSRSEYLACTFVTAASSLWPVPQPKVPKRMDTPCLYKPTPCLSAFRVPLPQLHSR